ncbi:VC2046/SO_2500 family protein [Aeromonas bivalvium]|uniref:VC2046/SO_2500 family protein n=1 Tax=Aeromonas bivalvium TaxID=440079 RepID=UPI0038D03BE8
MLPNAIRERLLVDESQLDQRLNQDLLRGDRTDFRLHLALLTEAVEEQPWFDEADSLPREEIDWRARLGLAPATPLHSDTPASSAHLTERLQQGGSMADARLWLALHPQPLAGRRPLLDPAVYDNLSALGRERLQAGWSLPNKGREARPLVMLPLLDRLAEGVDAALHWQS